MSGTALLERPEETTTVNSRRACEIAGITYRQLDYWVRCKYVTASTTASGSGSRRAFTAADVRGIAALGALTSQSANDLTGARSLFEFGRDNSADAAIVDGSTVESLTTSRIVDSVIARDAVLVVPLIPLEEIEDVLLEAPPSAAAGTSAPPRGGRLSYEW